MIRNTSLINRVLLGDCTELIREVETDSVHLILSDIPYGIGADDWDVLHDNTNSAFLGSSPAQASAGAVFKRRGKPLNGWSGADRLIPGQYYEWCRGWAGEWLRVLRPGGSAIVFAGRRLAPRCVCALEDTGFTFRDMLAWSKERAAHRAQRLSAVYERRGDKESANAWDGWKVGNLRPVYEPVLWFMKPYRIGGTIADNALEHGVGAYNEKAFLSYCDGPENIIRIGPERSDTGLHPTQKPLRLMQALVELTTREGQTVLDPFCGSGTALVAAASLGRNFIGMELYPEYFTTAAERLEQFRKNENGKTPRPASERGL